jgi:signal transduction histidine kinase
MRERILDLGGTLDIHSEINGGTELLITLPPPEVKDAPG